MGIIFTYVYNIYALLSILSTVMLGNRWLVFEAFQVDGKYQEQLFCRQAFF